MRHFPVVFALLISFCLTVATAQAQDAPADATALDEYNDLPPGLLMPNGPNNTPDVNNNTNFFGETPKDETDIGNAMTMEDIATAFQQGKYDSLIKNLTPLAESNHPPAMEMLGIMYHNGQGVEKNNDKAYKWLSKAAEANLPISQHHLAIMLFLGEGVTKDPNKALMWLNIAILHYQDGPDKDRAKEDKANVAAQLTRRDKERAVEMTRDWLKKRGERISVDLE